MKGMQIKESLLNCLQTQIVWRKPQSGGNWPNDGQQGQEAGGFTPDLSEFEFLSPEEIQEQLRILQGYQGIQPQGQIQAGYGDGNQGAGGYQDEEYEGYDDGGGYDEYERAIAEAEMRRPGRRTGGPTTSRYTNEDEMLQQAIQMSLMINEPEESPQPPRPPTSSTGTIPKPSWYRMTPSASSTPQANTPQSRQYVPTPQSGQSNVSSTSRAASRISIQLEHSFPQHNVPPTMRSQTESGLTQKKIDEINLANELYAQQLLGQRAGQQTPLTPSSDLYSLTSFANQTPFGLPVGTGQPESSMYTPRPTPRSRTLRLGTPQTRTRHADVYQRTTGHLRTPSSIRRPSAPPSPPSEPGSDRYIHQFLENALVRTVPPQLDLRSRSTGIPLGSSIDQITSSQWLTPEERAQEIMDPRNYNPPETFGTTEGSTQTGDQELRRIGLLRLLKRGSRVPPPFTPQPLPRRATGPNARTPSSSRSYSQTNRCETNRFNMYRR